MNIATNYILTIFSVTPCRFWYWNCKVDLCWRYWHNSDICGWWVVSNCLMFIFSLNVNFIAKLLQRTTLFCWTMSLYFSIKLQLLNYSVMPSIHRWIIYKQLSTYFVQILMRVPGTSRNVSRKIKCDKISCLTCWTHIQSHLWKRRRVIANARICIIFQLQNLSPLTFGCPFEGNVMTRQIWWFASDYRTLLLVDKTW